MTALGILLAHLVGDYLIQSDWMAIEKTKKWWPAITHGTSYTLPYAVVTQSPLALALICISHIVIDRYRLARYVVWAKNMLAPKAYRFTWTESHVTGYHDELVECHREEMHEVKPVWMAVWLMIIADNTLHLCINAAAVWYL